MATQELAKTQAQVPELVRPPMELDADDVALPKVKIGQYTADSVKDQLVKAGSIFTITGADDPDPVVLLAPEGRKKDTSDQDGVLFHVLGMRKGLSYSPPGGQLETWAFGDPSAPAEAWTTYTYYVVLPEHDDAFPYTWLFTKTAKPAARQINTAWARSGKAPEELAFRATTKHRENTQGEWFVPIISSVKAEDKNIEIARALIPMLAGQRQDEQSPTEQPAI